MTGPLQRPLSARSVMASLLLGMHPARMRGARLVEWCALFGIAEGTARVALSRMVARGELAVSGGVYELAGGLAARQPVQEWSLRPDLRAWEGAWLVGLVGGVARPAVERQALRDAMRRLHLGEVRPGVWARPDNLPQAAFAVEAYGVADGQCGWWHGHPDDGPVELASDLFDPEAWSRRARELVARLEVVTDDLASGDAGLVAEDFVVGAAALVHVRADPLLPPELLPSGWPGGALRGAYRAYRAAFAAAAEAWFHRAL